MDDLVRDGQELRDCTRNRYQLGYWRSLWYFHSYKDHVTIQDVKDIGKAFSSVLFHLVTIILYTLSLPVAPFAACLLRHREVMRRVSGEMAGED